MGNELTVKEKDLAAIIENTQLADMIKPLVREVYLFDSFVAGTTYSDPEIIKGLQEDEMLKLQRENNKFDELAILLLKESGEKVGYVPEKDNAIFARLMDAGKLLKAKITKIDKHGSFYRVAIGIYLIDF